jgi:hypothetical protein
MSDDVISWQDSTVWRFAEAFPRRGFTLQVYAVADRSRDWTWAIHLLDARLGPIDHSPRRTFRSRTEAQAECERQYRMLRSGRDYANATELGEMQDDDQ